MTERRGTAEPARLTWSIAAALRVGTTVAMALIAAGYGWASVSGQPRGGTRPIAEEMAGLGGDALTAIGLLVLTVIPILMLGAAAIAFARAGERRMATVTTTVGLLLAGSLVAAAVIGPAI